MLTYHPIFDSNHCLFRVLYILNELDEVPHEIDKIRLFDFYISAPGALKLFRANSKQVTSQKKSILKSLSKYDGIDNSKSLFFDARTIQVTVLNHLAAKNIILTEHYEKGLVMLNKIEFKSVISDILSNQNSITDSVVSLIVDELQYIHVLGHNGLKHRSNLMEYRYDVL